MFEEPKLSYKASSSGEKDHKNQFEFNTNARYKGKKQIKIRTYSHRSWSSSSNRCCPSFTFEIHWSKSISSLPSLCLGFSATNPNERRQLRNYRSSVWVCCQLRKLPNRRMGSALFFIYLFSFEWLRQKANNPDFFFFFWLPPPIINTNYLNNRNII